MDGLRSVSSYPRHDQISWRNTQSLGKDSSGNWTIGRGGKLSAPAEWVRESHLSAIVNKKAPHESTFLYKILQLNILAQTVKIGPPLHLLFQNDGKLSYSSEILFDILKF